MSCRCTESSTSNDTRKNAFRISADSETPEPMCHFCRTITQNENAEMQWILRHTSPGGRQRWAGEIGTAFIPLQNEIPDGSPLHVAAPRPARSISGGRPLCSSVLRGARNAQMSAANNRASWPCPSGYKIMTIFCSSFLGPFLCAVGSSSLP